MIDPMLAGLAVYTDKLAPGSGRSLTLTLAGGIVVSGRMVSQERFLDNWRQLLEGQATSPVDAAEAAAGEQQGFIHMENATLYFDAHKVSVGSLRCPLTEVRGFSLQSLPGVDLRRTN